MCSVWRKLIGRKTVQIQRRYPSTSSEVVCPPKAPAFLGRWVRDIRAKISESSKVVIVIDRAFASAITGKPKLGNLDHLATNRSSGSRSEGSNHFMDAGNIRFVAKRARITAWGFEDFTRLEIFPRKRRRFLGNNLVQEIIPKNLPGRL